MTNRGTWNAFECGQAQQPTPLGSSRTTSPTRRAAPDFGHRFNDDLICHCGKTWAGQQHEPTACPKPVKRTSDKARAEHDERFEEGWTG